MSFDVAADAYDRFMGRYSVHLSPQLADLAGIEPGKQALDVGCGPGALTSELVARLGTDAVTAVDPSDPFVEAARERNPGVVVERASVERLPFADGRFDVALAQLVVHFMDDPVAGLREMARVTREGGVVAASVWDLAGGRAPLSPFWDAARTLDPEARDELDRPGTGQGHLAELFQEAGLRSVREETHTATSEFATFDEWWEPYTFGVGPAGGYVARLDAETRDRVRDACRARLPEPPFTLTSSAWAVRGVV